MLLLICWSFTEGMMDALMQPIIDHYWQAEYDRLVTMGY